LFSHQPFRRQSEDANLKQRDERIRSKTRSVSFANQRLNLGWPKMTELFRGMKEDAGGMPELGESSRSLGVRPGIDVAAAKSVDSVFPGQGGMSVSPDDPQHLPYYRRPATLGGTGKDPVWRIADVDLGQDLQYRPDPARGGHGFVEPARSMTLAEYQRALAQTQRFWQMI
jgi:hypothetical protein